MCQIWKQTDTKCLELVSSFLAQPTFTIQQPHQKEMVQTVIPFNQA